MGSQSRRQCTVDRKRTDQLGQSSRSIAQANEYRLRLWRQKYAEEQVERRATSSSQRVASGSQRGIRRKEQHTAKLLLANLSNGLQTIKGTYTRDDMIAKRCVVKWTGRAQKSDNLSVVERASPKLVDSRDSFLTDCQANHEAPESCHSPM
ncbi:hypothetical protein R1sor_017805 [Riccia sorocarpa]|uniref:Uncharacterized protein n=1 Tax=Riccia sorocarpa TaxID=122646 RepID=A0ABD3I7Z3_9MARC